MSEQFKIRLDGDPTGKMETASFKLPFDTRKIWGKARVPVKVTINAYTWRSTVATKHACQYIVVNAQARRSAGVKAGDMVTVTLEPDTEKRDIEVPAPLHKALGRKLAQKLDSLSFTRKKEFILWYSEAKREETRARRIEKMKQILSSDQG
jgi:uncharacterized protein YdeI (YjbR/CyaY-like superfamily)